MVVAPLGSQRAVVSTTPLGQAIGGFFFLLIGIIAAVSVPQAGIILLFPIVVGIVFLLLGAMRISIPSQQVTFQGSGSTSAYEPTPKGFLKKCPRCGEEIPIASLFCSKCGATRN